jgi:transcriptional regulator with XRE-family HTH domain
VDRLAELRESQALTLRDLAERSGVDANTINQVELGHRKPRPSTLRKLAKALNVEVSDLVREPAVPLDEAPRGAGQREKERSALEVAREAGRKQYEMDQKASNRLAESEIQQTYFARAHDEALFGDLRHRHPDELADALLDSGRDAARLKEENARLKEENARLKEENARLRQDLAEDKTEAEREQEAAR